MDIKEMEVGELYNLRGRRAKLESFSFTPGGDGPYRPHRPDNPYVEAIFLTGRSLDQQTVLRGTQYNPSVLRDIQETWEGCKQRKEEARSDRKQAEELTVELRQVAGKIGINSCWVSPGGQVNIYGSLKSVRNMVEMLAAGLEDQADDSDELGELLG